MTQLKTGQWPKFLENSFFFSLDVSYEITLNIANQQLFGLALGVNTLYLFTSHIDIFNSLEFMDASRLHLYEPGSPMFVRHKCVISSTFMYYVPTAIESAIEIKSPR